MRAKPFPSLGSFQDSASKVPFAARHGSLPKRVHPCFHFIRQDATDLAMETYICDYRQPHQVSHRYVRACGGRVRSTDGLGLKRSWKQSWPRTCHGPHISTSEIFPNDARDKASGLRQEGQVSIGTGLERGKCDADHDQRRMNCFYSSLATG